MAAGRPVPDPMPIRALLDTGEVGTAINSAVIASLGLVPVGTTEISTPSTGAALHPCHQYDAMIAIYMDPPEIHTASLTIPVIGASLAHMGIQALIGRDILNKGILIYNGRSGHITLAF